MKTVWDHNTTFSQKVLILYLKLYIFITSCHRLEMKVKLLKQAAASMRQMSMRALLCFWNNSNLSGLHPSINACPSARIVGVLVDSLAALGGECGKTQQEIPTTIHIHTEINT